GAEAAAAVEGRGRLSGSSQTSSTEARRVIDQRNAVVAGQIDVLGPAISAGLAEVRLANDAEQDVIGPAAAASIARSFWVGLAVSAAALLIGILAAILVGRGIARPVAAMTAAMRGLAAGDKGIEIPARGRRDEVGEMAAA